MFLKNLFAANDLDDIKIDKIEVLENTNTIILYALSQEIIDLNHIENIKEEIRKHYNNIVNIEIQLNYKLSKNINVEKIKENIFYIINKSSNMLSKAKDNIMIEFKNDCFFVIANNKLLINELIDNNIERKVKNLICEYTLNYNIETIYQEAEDEAAITTQRIFDEELKKSLQVIKNNSSERKPANKAQEGKYKKRSRKKIDFDSIPLSVISDITNDSGVVKIKGRIVNVDKRELKNGSLLMSVSITDFTDTIICKYFCPKDFDDKGIEKGKYLQIAGNAEYDEYEKELIVKIQELQLKTEEMKRMDNAEEKRVELHLHTGMSSMDGINSFKEYAKKAKQWGHKAIAINDHGVVQGYPEAMECADDNFKIIYGMEGYLINDTVNIVNNCENIDLDSDFVVFDLETTGLNPKNDHIIEIGAVKISNRKVIDSFSTFVHTDRKLPEKIIELTSITDDMLVGQPDIGDALPSFLDFAKGSVLVAHNAKFDVGFIREKAKVLSIENYNPSTLDTLELSKALIKDVKNHRLNTLTKKLGISLLNHHRAVDDANATGQLFIILLNKLREREIYDVSKLNELLKEDIDIVKQPYYHINILVKNYTGLKNLYNLVSDSHINNFYKKPRLLKSNLSNLREGLILGTACESGELYRAILEGKSDEKIEEIADYYDFYEIQPLNNNMFLVNNERLKGVEELKEINKKIIQLGEKKGKTSVATGDVHFLEPEDEIYRRILMSGQGYEDAEKQAPLYFKTTEEMLDDFSYLGEEKAYEVVVKNTNLIADLIEPILPIPKGTFPPVMKGSDNELRNICFDKAKSIYGEKLPDIVESRLNRELNSIIGNGYSVMYMIAQKLVKKSNEDGYLVGSRGSVGSSFAATMAGITEVNPLVPHYVCPKCKYSEFIEDGSYGSGFDLLDKSCPVCSTLLIKDGHDIPFEVFLGFEGDKEPDIDLNFAGEEQGVCMKYTEELFGKGKVFRAGTISTIADKTAYGFVKNYFEERGISKRKAEIKRLIQGCLGIKRTSGQHPGGVMIVPEDKDIYDFTPVQYPANNEKSGTITTHFDYQSISGRILKLDLLGHDTPSIIRMLEDLTGLENDDIPTDDQSTMAIFNSPEILGISLDEINCSTGTLAIPEFGTPFVRQMIMDTKPKSFSDLVRISGLSHGTDVWINNAQDIIKKGYAEIGGVISTRDDIMTYLIQMGVDKKTAFDIMERVRKGKGLRKEDEEAMKKQNVPKWYIDSCNTIKYMFPKAHAVAYVTMSVKIAYFKVHYPEAFYATYFSTKVDDFDADIVTKGQNNILSTIRALEEKGNDKTTKEKNLITVLEVAYEMYKRGFKFTKVDLYKSDDRKFLLTEDGILPPLMGLAGLGANAAANIKAEREISRFISIEDIIKRAKVTKTVIEVLENHGCLKNMDETNQISIFNV
ncbi:MAG: PolC-type DNA polymerase III [Tissierellia bacterium]|nr:PolC-type DNA polymerase III [Tissierellia bacterium]MDD3226078.1 PolC-type DNA polymerase III [Tissierellia bacterium]MDD4045698.1 PolC-type DNA polymerase III [Tissierellia bacterium]MDD4677653.1 PolC-type DNA polymerase III [Tissierellia bacterium]